MCEYICDAFDGFLNQKTDFSFKILVYDDASTDGTEGLLLEYKNRYPELFDYYISKENTGITPELKEKMDKWFIEHVDTEYVALCEGDDYWIDKNKLQMQIDYMNEHPDCVLSCHASVWLDCETGMMKEYHPYNCDQNLCPKDIIYKPNGNIPTASILCKTETWLLSRSKEFPPSGTVGDITLQFAALCMGKIRYFDKPLSVYRYHRRGSWTSTFSYNTSFFISHSFALERFYREYDFFSGLQFHNEICMASKKNRRYLTEKRREIGWELFCDCLVEKNDLDNPIIQQIMEEQKRIYEMEEGIYKLSEYEGEIIKEKKNVAIYGNGKYAGLAHQVLKCNGITCVGYVISDEEPLKRKLDIEVWHLSQYPYSIKDTVFVIGMHEKWQEEMEQFFDKIAGFSWWAPFWPEDIHRIGKDSE